MEPNCSHYVLRPTDEEGNQPDRYMAAMEGPCPEAVFGLFRVFEIRPCSKE